MNREVPIIVLGKGVSIVQLIIQKWKLSIPAGACWKTNVVNFCSKE